MGDDRDAGECHRRASADDRNDKSPNPEEVGPLTLVYETKVVTADDIGGVALDEHGRELEIRYGIVLRGRDGGGREQPAARRA